MRHGSLFSGIGGFDLAAEWMGWDNIFHCEKNDFCKKVLKYYWPNLISYDDIKTTDFTVHTGQIDILTGGFPCQPYSLAGKRKGKEDDRHLWPEMLRAIREIQPTWVVGENVFGLINWAEGMVFNEVQADLEAEGYEVQPYVLPACTVNAPHRRDRVWFIAYSNSFRNNRMYRSKECYNEREQPTYNEQSGNGRTSEVERHGKSGIITNPNCNGFNRCDCEHEKHSGERREYALNDTKQVCESSDTHNKVMERFEIFGNTKKSWKDEHKQSTGLLCSNWQNFPTQSPICGRNDGLSSKLSGITFPKHRNESIKSYGNAVVPHLVLQIFKTIEQFINASPGN